jgi:uncharacterized membrane protein YjjP (DUF1212 family)
MLLRAIKKAHQDEEGHALPLLGALVAAAGVVVLAIGAANDSGPTAIAGGIIGAVGILAELVLNHMFVDWELFRRTEK